MTLEVFAANVTSLKGLPGLLREAAQAELGANAHIASIEKRANGFLLETMISVGIDPATEEKIRNLIFDALKGKPLNDAMTLELVEYVLGQMVAKPKGALAERLARITCAAKIAELQSSGALPLETGYLASVWSKRISRVADGSRTVQFSEWRDGADGVVFCRPGSYPVTDFRTGHVLNLISNCVLVVGVVEVKARRTLPKGEPKRQLDKHLARLTQGLQTRDKRAIALHLEADQIYFAAWDNGGFRALPARDLVFSTKDVAKDWEISWTSTIPVLQWAIGPRPTGQARRISRFDGFLPYSVAELEQFGNDVMHYTLGVMGDDREQVDLPGSEWAWNLERLFDSVDKTRLKSYQQVRLKKLISWLRGQPWT